MPTFTQGNSARWRIFDAFATALESATELQGVTIKRNPTSPPNLKKGEYQVAVRWSGDALRERKGLDDLRRFNLIVASLAQTDQSDRDADAMHLVVSTILAQTMQTLNALTGVKEVSVREADVTSFVEDFQPIEGALVLSSFEVTYRQRAFQLLPA